MKTKYLPVLAFIMLMGAFLFPVSAYAAEPDSVTPPSVTAAIEGEQLRIETTAGYYGVEAVYINDTRFNYRVDSVVTVDAQFYCGDSETVTVYAVDFAGNKSNEVTLANPYYIKEEPPKEANPFTPDGQASVVDTATEDDGKTFYTFTTPDDNVFYLVIDHARDTDNVYFLNAVTESDLLALAAEPAEAETVIPTPQPSPPPAEDSPDDEEPAEPGQPEKKGGSGSLIFVLLGVAAVGGAGYYFKIVKPKQQGQAYDDDDYGDEPEDDGKEIEFEDEQEEADDETQSGDADGERNGQDG